jgi:uncharacterized Zn-finger protein
MPKSHRAESAYEMKNETLSSERPKVFVEIKNKMHSSKRSKVFIEMKNETLSCERPKVFVEMRKKFKKGLLSFYVIHNFGWKIVIFAAHRKPAE